MENFTPRPVDDLLWPQGSVRLPVPSWKSFLDIWNRFCSNVRIRKQYEDTCPECYVLSNEFQFKEAPDHGGDDSDGSNSDSSDNEHYPYEELIEQASNHAEEAQQQQRLAMSRQQLAMDEAEEPHEDRRFVFLFFLLFMVVYPCDLPFSFL
jgi:hypothetical protein